MIVVKFGGHAMRDENGSFGAAILRAQRAGEQVVVVHGGGPQIDAALSEQGIISEWIGGFRVTTEEIFTVVERVLVEEVGPDVAMRLNQVGVKAQSISARTLPTIIARPRITLVDGTPVDLGFVGDIESVDTTQILELLDRQIVPVIAPISSDVDLLNGLNVNADFAAAAIAGALDASVLVVMTDVTGIYRNWPDASSLISSISVDELESIKTIFSEGMAPKVQASLDAIAAGAKAVRIINGTDPESFANALAGHGGTLVSA